MRPRISINFAISADGKITNAAGMRSGWTSAADHARLRDLRSAADALMVGRGTLQADQMSMAAPGNPLRCVVSRHGIIDPSHPLFHSPGGPIHLLGTDSLPPPHPAATSHQGSLADFLATLYRNFGVKHLHCEGGGQLVHHLAELDLIDEIHLTWAAHTLFGGSQAPGITGVPGNFLPSTRHFELSHFEPLPQLGECFLSYRRKSK